MQSLLQLRYKILSGSFICIIIIFSIYGCDPTLNPVKEDERTFSVFGYLNASADTQFVRIEKLRDNMFTDTPQDLEAKVTLTNIKNGQTVALKESLFQYQSGMAHNYYTAMEIAPEGKYRLDITDGNVTSSAEVNIPDTFSEPALFKRGNFVEVQNIDRLIAVKTIYKTCKSCGGFSSCPDEPFIRRDEFAHLEDTTHLSGGGIKANYDKAEDIESINNNYPPKSIIPIVKNEVVIVAGTPEWPDFLRLNREAMALPDIASNIQNGVGLLGGIVSDTITIETNSPEPCYTSTN